MQRATVTVGVLYIATLVILSQRLGTRVANRIRELVGTPAFVEQGITAVPLAQLRGNGNG